MTSDVTSPESAAVWEEGIRRLIAEVSGLPTFWREQPRPAVFPGQRGFVTLFVTADDVVSDEVRETVNGAAAIGLEIEPAVAELHTVSLQVQIETYDNRARSRGRWYAARIRTRLRRESSLLALGEVASALIDVTPITSASLPVDNRATSTSTMIVRLHTATCERDKALGYIDDVELTYDGAAVVITDALVTNASEPLVTGNGDALVAT